MLGRIARMSFCLNAEGNGIKKLLSYTKINRSPNNESRSEVKSASEYNHVSQLVSYLSRTDLIGNAKLGQKREVKNRHLHFLHSWFCIIQKSQMCFTKGKMSPMNVIKRLKDWHRLPASSVSPL